MFIVIEGGEGAGKSTQIALLKQWLSALQVEHVSVREPGGTPVGEEVRQAVLHSGDMPAKSELFLYLAARAALVESVIRPALSDGKVVIADRYALSSYAYQGHGRGLPIQEVKSLNGFATGGLWPDMTIVLKVPPGQREERRKERRHDRIERAGPAFHDRVTKAYGLLAGEPGVRTVDGTGAPEEVQARIRALLHETFPETFPEPRV